MTIVDDNDGKKITVKEVIRLSEAALLVVAFCFWGVAEANLVLMLGQQVKNFSSETVLLSGCFLLFQLFGIALISIFLWRAFGSQAISLRGSEIIVTNKIWSYNSQKPKSFNVRSMSNVRSEERTHRSKFGELGKDFSIVFDYSGQKEELLTSLTKEQANSLLGGALKTLVAPQ